jgi:N-acyl-D-aspartate/D-glutamate deacylase
MPEFDVIIKNGTIVDGTRVPRYRADIAIKHGRIAEIGRLQSRDATTVLDATGLMVAPGAIDLHTHYDAQLHWDPYCSIGSWHGVTSVTIGNCGFGFAPVHSKDADRAMLALSRNEAIPLEPMKVSMPFDWETFPQWMDHLDRIPLGINLSQLVPVTPVVAYAMGGFAEAKKRLPNEKEMQNIVRLLHEAMDAGAVGWGAQRLFPDSLAAVQRDYDGTPMISDVLPDEFYLTLAKVLRERGAGCIQFTQAGGNFVEGFEGIMGALRRDFGFNVRLAEESGRPVLYNVIAANDQFPFFYREQLKMLEEANAKGVPVFGQAATVRANFTFTFEDWNLFDNSPVWREATVGTVEEKKAKLANPDIRRAMKEEYNSGQVSIDLFGRVAEFIAQEVFRPDLKEQYEGLSVQQIADRENKHIIDAILDLSVADNLKTEWRTPLLNVDVAHHKEIMSSPYTIAGISDGGAHTKFLTTGVWPTDMLTWMVRDTGALSLEEAHFRLSALPAWAAGFKDRGILREGMAADIVVYDLARLAIGPTEIAHDVPAGEWRRIQKAEGYRWIMVNGQVTFADGKCTGATPGRLLRHGQASQ